MRRLLLYILIGAALLTLGIWLGRHDILHPAPAPVTVAPNPVKEAALLLESGEARAAFEKLQWITATDDSQFIPTLLEVATANTHTQQIETLYQSHPQAVAQFEPAALLLASTLLEQSRFNEYQTLKKTWEGTSEQIGAWILLDADVLVMQGKPNQAIGLLKSQRFFGQQETDRLVRLALLYLNDHPKTSWDYLTLALQQDPQNPDLNTYRARLLESVGKSDLAEQEYQAALRIDPQNPVLSEQLGDFYARQGDYQAALTFWTAHLDDQSRPERWEKAQFWSLMSAPSIEAVNTTFPPDGQAAFWQNIVELLEQKQLTAALQEMEKNDRKSWQPDLELALRRTLAFRLYGTFGLIDSPALQELQRQVSLEDHPLFAAIESNAEHATPDTPTWIQSPGLAHLIRSEEIWSALFLASGWNEAAIRLHRVDPYLPEFPTWLAFQYTQALEANRGKETAIAFALKQKPAAALTLYAGELLIRVGKGNEALTILTPLFKEDTEMGARATWLAALLYLDARDYDKAQKVIEGQPRLAKTLEGQETLAKIALLKNDVAQATRLYETIMHQSDEAKHFLAKQAFANRDWKKAQELTENLLKTYPDNVQLEANLHRIKAEQGT